MKTRRGTLRKAFMGIALISSFWATTKLCHFLLSASSYEFTFDPKLSELQQEKIIFAVRHSDAHTPQQVATLIKKKCSAVADVLISLLANRVWHIEVTAAQPFVMVNNDWILSQEGTVVPSTLYAPQYLRSIAHITMQLPSGQAPCVSQAFKQWLVQLDRSVLHQYAIIWHNDYHIQLNKKNDSLWALRCHCLQPLNNTLLAYSDQVRKELEEKMKGQHQRKTWIADIRFEKQIVLSAPKGEGVLNG